MPGQCGAGAGQAVSSAQAWVDLVVADAVRRPDDVVGPVVGQHRLKAFDQLSVAQRYRGPRWAARPHPHQPHRVESRVGERGKPLVRHRGQVDTPSSLGAELMQPRPRIDFIDVRLRG
jgi:hypothetical protein